MQTALMALLLCFLMLAGCVATTSSLTLTTTTASGTLEQIPATMLKPEGPGPFPAIVIMHDCSGPRTRSSGAPMRWARELVEKGYVIIIHDSFTPRGFAGGVCTNSSPNRNDVAPARRTPDAYAALAYLRTLPYVDGSRIGIMGGSHGGSTTLASVVAAETEKEPFAQEKRTGFIAAVALFPGCAARLGEWRTVRQAGGSNQITNYIGVYKPVAPLLILIGERDDWTPAEPCRKLTEIAR